MCIGVAAAAGLLLSAASTVAGFAQKQQEADAQNDRYIQNHQNSLAAARDSQKQILARQMQEQETTAQKEHDANVEGAERAADVSVSAAGGNVGGLSVDNLIADARMKTSVARARLERNYQMTAAQLQQQQEATVTQAQSRINSVAQAVGPSPLSAGLELAGAGVKAFKDAK